MKFCSNLRRATCAIGVMAASMLAATTASAEYGLNLQEPATPIAREIMTLHNGIMFACFVIFVLVFGVMFYSLFAHRKSRGVEPAQFRHSTKLEILWTIIPTLILVGFALPSTGTLIRMEDTSANELTVKITGYQWKWHYEYMDGDSAGVGFYSTLSTPGDQIVGKAPKGENYLLEVDKPLVLPAQTKVRFLITSGDVLHAWWIPQFGVKKDAIPGYINEAWTNVDSAGTFRGQCAELCGKDHGYMPIVVEVMNKQDFCYVDDQATGGAQCGQLRHRDGSVEVTDVPRKPDSNSENKTLTSDSFTSRGTPHRTKRCRSKFKESENGYRSCT